MTSDAVLSERDERILELNQRGLSAAQISKVLMSEGIELSKRSVLRHLTELRQDSDNNVQVNFKFKSHKPKSEFRWHKIVQVLRREIAEYTRTRGTKPSSRTMFYQLQDLGLVKPHEDTTYSRVTVLARLEWKDSNDELMYPKLDIDCFSDDSRLTSGEYDDDEPQEVVEPGKIPKPDEYIQVPISELKNAPDNYEGVGEVGIDGKIGGRWYGKGIIGFISSITEPFCGNCDRVRLTSDGRLLTCLFEKPGYDIRSMIRGRKSDQYIKKQILEDIRRKPEGIIKFIKTRTLRPSLNLMHTIGG